MHECRYSSMHGLLVYLKIAPNSRGSCYTGLLHDYKVVTAMLSKNKMFMRRKQFLSLDFHKEYHHPVFQLKNICIFFH